MREARGGAQIKADICVIGGGSGGLSVAAGTAQMGASTVLFERGKMGGDCLNYGCVPSKALLAAARAKAAVEQAGVFGVHAEAPRVAFNEVHDHVHGVIAAIAPHDSVERFEGLGVTVFQQAARFTGPQEVTAADGTVVRARRFVIATGSSPAAPPIEGIAGIDYLTNETVFDLTECPEHLIVIGGGPIGLELAQAHRRLGARVTVLEMYTVLGRDDPELAEIVKARVLAEGIEIHEGVEVVRFERNGGGVTAVAASDGQEHRIGGSHLLVATGRAPTVDGLDLEKAGVAYTRSGVEVDRRLRTTNKKIFAIGDVAGGYQFTHVASYHAGIVIRNALFRLPAKVDEKAIPWVTYTDPELAGVGLTEAQARERHGEVRVLRWPFKDNDRAQAERTTEGTIKVVTDRRGRVLGAGIVGSHAGELLQPWVLAIERGLKVGAMANLVVPYPTLGEVNKRVAGSFYTPTLYSERTRRIVRLLRYLG
ncbi:MAG: dihydrolipoyl dehydrogenase family protein [Alphaproteobacteria bacterium]